MFKDNFKDNQKQKKSILLKKISKDYQSQKVEQFFQGLKK